MKYKYLAVLSLVGLTALASSHWDRTKPEAWNAHYKGTPTAIAEARITADELEALNKASNSLRKGIKELTLNLVQFTKLPSLSGLTGLQTLVIDNKAPIEIDASSLPAGLRKLVLRNNAGNFQKPGVTVISYEEYNR